MAKGIDDITGMIYLHELVPNPGDAVVLRNAGAIYEVHQVDTGRPELALTDEDIERLRVGSLIFQ